MEPRPSSSALEVRSVF